MLEEGKLGFVILSKDDTEIMYQSWASLKKDLPQLAKAASKSVSLLYIEVESLDEIVRTLEGVEVVAPLRTTAYGFREIYVRDPNGTIVVFAERQK